MNVEGKKKYSAAAAARRQAARNTRQALTRRARKSQKAMAGSADTKAAANSSELCNSGLSVTPPSVAGS